MKQKMFPLKMPGLMKKEKGYKEMSLIKHFNEPFVRSVNVVLWEEGIKLVLEIVRVFLKANCESRKGSIKRPLPPLWRINTSPDVLHKNKWTRCRNMNEMSYAVISVCRTAFGRTTALLNSYYTPRADNIQLLLSFIDLTHLLPSP